MKGRLHVEASGDARAAPEVVWALLGSDEGGTHVHWSADFDRTVLGRLAHRTLSATYPEIVRGLIAAAERGTSTA